MFWFSKFDSNWYTIFLDSSYARATRFESGGVERGPGKYLRGPSAVFTFIRATLAGGRICHAYSRGHYTFYTWTTTGCSHGRYTIRTGKINNKFTSIKKLLIFIINSLEITCLPAGLIIEFMHKKKKYFRRNFFFNYNFLKYNEFEYIKWVLTENFFQLKQNFSYHFLDEWSKISSLLFSVLYVRGNWFLW